MERQVKITPLLRFSGQRGAPLPSQPGGSAALPSLIARLRAPSPVPTDFSPLCFQTDLTEESLGYLMELSTQEKVNL